MESIVTNLLSKNLVRTLFDMNRVNQYLHFINPLPLLEILFKFHVLMLSF